MREGIHSSDSLRVRFKKDLCNLARPGKHVQ